MYFVHFSSAARFAAVPAITFRCELANISGMVTSQASGLPHDHGINVAPSGRFPSVLDKSAGSLETGS